MNLFDEVGSEIIKTIHFFLYTLFFLYKPRLNREKSFFSKKKGFSKVKWAS